MFGAAGALHDSRLLEGRSSNLLHAVGAALGEQRAHLGLYCVDRGAALPRDLDACATAKDCPKNFGFRVGEAEARAIRAEQRLDSVCIVRCVGPAAGVISDSAGECLERLMQRRAGEWLLQIGLHPAIPKSKDLSARREIAHGDHKSVR